MPDLSKLSAAKLQALYDKREAACSANCTALIAAGRGMERGNETRAKAALPDADALSLEYIKVRDACAEVVSEMDYRKRWHGSLKPVKPTNAQLYR